MESSDRAAASPSPRRLTRHHWIAVLVLWVVFSGLTLVATWNLLSRPGIPPRIDGGWLFSVVTTTLATIAGPMTGAVARGSQSCCLEFSLRALAVAGPALLTGLALTLGLPRGRPWSWVRGAAWGLGWFVWFASGIVSLGHALE